MRCSIMLVVPVSIYMQAKDPHLDASLLDASAKYDVQAVKSLLAQGANANVKNEQGETPFLMLWRGVHSQARTPNWRKGRLETADLLFASGADPPQPGFRQDHTFGR